MDLPQEKQLERLKQHIDVLIAQERALVARIDQLEMLLSEDFGTSERKRFKSQLQKDAIELNRARQMIRGLSERYKNARTKNDLDNLDPVARYHLGFGKETRPKTKWQELVSTVKEKNPHLSFKEVLQLSKKLYTPKN